LRRLPCGEISFLFGSLLVGAWLGTPSYSPFHYGAHVLLIAAIVCSVILWLKPKVYDAADVESCRTLLALCGPGVDVYLSAVYLMSARII